MPVRDTEVNINILSISTSMVRDYINFSCIIQCTHCETVNIFLLCKNVRDGHIAYLNVSIRACVSVQLCRIGIMVKYIFFA